MIAKKVESIRKIKKISQVDLAEKIGLSSAGYQDNVYRDDFKVSTLIKIAQVLEVPIEAFFKDIPTTTSTLEKKVDEIKEMIAILLKKGGFDLSNEADNVAKAFLGKNPDKGQFQQGHQKKKSV